MKCSQIVVHMSLILNLCSSSLSILAESRVFLYISMCILAKPLVSERRLNYHDQLDWIRIEVLIVLILVYRPTQTKNERNTPARNPPPLSPLPRPLPRHVTSWEIDFAEGVVFYLQE